VREEEREGTITKTLVKYLTREGWKPGHRGGLLGKKEKKVEKKSYYYRPDLWKGWIRQAINNIESKRLGWGGNGEKQRRLQSYAIGAREGRTEEKK